MRMSDEGRRKLTLREGVRLKAYQDSIGVWTIGIGHTSAAGEPHVTEGLTITTAECDAIFKRDLIQYENAVNKAVTAKLNQNQFDALVSLCYNIGVGNFAKSSLVKKLNAGDTIGAADAFLVWNKAGGRVLDGLVKRRAAERAQFLSAPKTVAPAPPPPDIPKPVTQAKPPSLVASVLNAIAGLFGKK